MQMLFKSQGTALVDDFIGCGLTGAQEAVALVAVISRIIETPIHQATYWPARVKSSIRAHVI